MSALCSFREELRVAAGKGYVYKVTTTYVKLHWWSLKGYFATMSPLRIKCIGKSVIRRIYADARRAESNKKAYEAHQIKRNDVFGDAAEAISTAKN